MSTPNQTPARKAAEEIEIPTDMKVLSLDLATCTGWAMLANGVLTSGSEDFHRWLRFFIQDHKPAPWMVDWLAAHGPKPEARRA